MKNLPPYLENILDHMAESEEKTGKLPKGAAKALFKKELISESLTAKANPQPTRNSASKKPSHGTKETIVNQIQILDQLFRTQPLTQEQTEYYTTQLERLKALLRKDFSSDDDGGAAANPTIKPFHEIYDIAGEDFNNSPFGRALGRMTEGMSASKKAKNPKLEITGYDKSKGRKFFEDMRNFASNTADAVIEGIFGKSLSRAYKPKKATANIMNLNGSGEYPAGGLKGDTLTEANVTQIETENARYYKLLVSSLIFGLIEPIFQMNKKELEGLLYELSPKPKSNEPKEVERILRKVATPEFRKQFIRDVIELMRERNGIVAAAIENTSYIGKIDYKGEQIRNNVVNQVAELDKIKKAGQKSRLPKL